MQCPPKSGHEQEFPEVDRADWFNWSEPHTRILKGQVVFLNWPMDRFHLFLGYMKVAL
jgi:predicted NUDIX family NTP pyrophosphohydrolase